MLISSACDISLKPNFEFGLWGTCTIVYLCQILPTNLSCERLHSVESGLCDLQKKKTRKLGGCLRVSVSFSLVFCIFGPGTVHNIVSHCASLDVWSIVFTALLLHSTCEVHSVHHVTALNDVFFGHSFLCSEQHCAFVGPT